MATSVNLMRRYVWLVDTVRRAGRVTIDDINNRWADNVTLNTRHESGMPERTFHRHREAILDMFGVEIACDRSTNTYYIKNMEALSSPSFTNWIFNGLAIDNQLLCNEDVRRRIVFEDVPGGTEFLPVIVEAIAAGRVLSVAYRSYYATEDREWIVEPRGLKQYRRRWYLIGKEVGSDFRPTFALDRIVDVAETDAIFDPSAQESIDAAFGEVVGVCVSTDFDVEDVTVRVFGKQRHYFEGTPLHRSQSVVQRTSEYTDYHFRVRPEYEFQHELLRLGPDAEVLSPEWLRGEMRWLAEEMLKRYNS